MGDDVLVERDGDVEIVTLNRPAVRNALGRRAYDELERAVRGTTARCLVPRRADTCTACRARSRFATIRR